MQIYKILGSVAAFQRVAIDLSEFDVEREFNSSVTVTRIGEVLKKELNLSVITPETVAYTAVTELIAHVLQNLHLGFGRVAPQEYAQALVGLIDSLDVTLASPAGETVVGNVIVTDEERGVAREFMTTAIRKIAAGTDSPGLRGLDVTDDRWEAAMHNLNDILSDYYTEIITDPSNLKKKRSTISERISNGLRAISKFTTNVETSELISLSYGLVSGDPAAILGILRIIAQAGIREGGDTTAKGTSFAFNVVQELVESGKVSEGMLQGLTEKLGTELTTFEGKYTDPLMNLDTTGLLDKILQIPQNSTRLASNSNEFGLPDFETKIHGLSQTGAYNGSDIEDFKKELQKRLYKYFNDTDIFFVAAEKLSQDNAAQQEQATAELSNDEFLVLEEILTKRAEISALMQQITQLTDSMHPRDGSTKISDEEKIAFGDELVPLATTLFNKLSGLWSTMTKAESVRLLDSFGIHVDTHTDEFNGIAEELFKLVRRVKVETLAHKLREMGLDEEQTARIKRRASRKIKKQIKLGPLFDVLQPAAPQEAVNLQNRDVDQDDNRLFELIENAFTAIRDQIVTLTGSLNFQSSDRASPDVPANVKAMAQIESIVKAVRRNISEVIHELRRDYQAGRTSDLTDFEQRALNLFHMNAMAASDLKERMITSLVSRYMENSSCSDDSEDCERPSTYQSGGQFYALNPIQSTLERIGNSEKGKNVVILKFIKELGFDLPQFKFSEIEKLQNGSVLANKISDIYNTTTVKDLVDILWAPEMREDMYNILTTRGYKMDSKLEPQVMEDLSEILLHVLMQYDVDFITENEFARTIKDIKQHQSGLSADVFLSHLRTGKVVTIFGKPLTNNMIIEKKSDGGHELRGDQGGSTVTIPDIYEELYALGNGIGLAFDAVVDQATNFLHTRTFNPADYETTASTTEELAKLKRSVDLFFESKNKEMSDPAGEELRICDLMDCQSLRKPRIDGIGSFNTVLKGIGQVGSDCIKLRIPFLHEQKSMICRERFFNSSNLLKKEVQRVKDWAWSDLLDSLLGDVLPQIHVRVNLIGATITGSAPHTNGATTVCNAIARIPDTVTNNEDKCGLMGVGKVVLNSVGATPPSCPGDVSQGVGLECDRGSQPGSESDPSYEIRMPNFDTATENELLEFDHWLLTSIYRVYDYASHYGKCDPLTFASIRLIPGWEIVHVIDATYADKDIPPLPISVILQSKANRDQYIVSTRGTITSGEWALNFTTNQVPFIVNQGYYGQVHYGVHAAARQLSDEVLKYFTTVGVSKSAQIYATGHSLGGGLVDIMSMILKIEGKFSNVRESNFAGVRVYDEFAMSQFAEHIPLRKLAIDLDLVPQIPCSNMPVCKSTSNLTVIPPGRTVDYYAPYDERVAEISDMAFVNPDYADDSIGEVSIRWWGLGLDTSKFRLPISLAVLKTHMYSYMCGLRRVGCSWNDQGGYCTM